MTYDTIFIYTYRMVFEDSEAVEARGGYECACVDGFVRSPWHFGWASIDRYFEGNLRMF